MSEPLLLLPQCISLRSHLQKYRGRMTALFQFNVISGILIAYVSNYLLRNAGDEPWRWMLGVAGIPSAIYLYGTFCDS